MQEAKAFLDCYAYGLALEINKLIKQGYHIDSVSIIGRYLNNAVIVISKEDKK